MSKSVSHLRIIPAFRIDIDEFKELISELENELNRGSQDRSACRFSINIKIKNSDLSFGSIDELLESSKVPNLIGSWSVSISKDGRDLRIEPSTFIFQLGHAIATSPSEIWSLGSTGFTKRFLTERRRWFSILLRIPAGLLLLLWVPLAGIAYLYFYSSPHENMTAVLRDWWLPVTWGLAVFWLLQQKALPSSVIVVREQKGWFREYSTEIGVAVAALAVVVGVIGLFK